MFHIRHQSADLQLRSGEHPVTVIELIRPVPPQYFVSHSVPLPVHLHGHAVRTQGLDLYSLAGGAALALAEYPQAADAGGSAIRLKIKTKLKRMLKRISVIQKPILKKKK